MTRIQVVTQAKALLSYIVETGGQGIVFDKRSQDAFGEKDELKFPRSESHVEAYADASFAPAAENFKSVHGTMTMVAGCPVLWSSACQPFVCGSTAEAELIGYAEVHQQAEGVGRLWV